MREELLRYLSDKIIWQKKKRQTTATDFYFTVQNKCLQTNIDYNTISY